MHAFLIALLAAPAPAGEPPERPEVAALGELAPDFTLRDLDGEEVKLSELEGKTVVIEWFNPDCPFVRYAHGEQGPLRELTGRFAGGELVWLAINSGAPGRQGHGAQRNREAAQEYAIDYPVLLDESGAVGRSFEARTTPQLFIIDAEGVLAYRGGLDNAPLGRGAGERVDFVSGSLEALAGDRAPPRQETPPYGCSVKYSS